MEKLIQQWHERKEPGHLAGRAGSFVCFALLSLAAFSQIASAQSQSHGHPAKAIRILSPGTRTTGPTAADLPAPREIEVETVTLTEPEPAMVIEARQSRRRPTVILITDGPYLPVAGAPPLRFAAAPSWPQPLPPPAPDVTDIEAPVATSGTTSALDPLSSPDAANAEAAAAGGVANSIQNLSIARNVPDGTPLTADMVLSFLGDMPARETRVPVRFEPAIPAGAASAGGPLSP